MSCKRILIAGLFIVAVVILVIATLQLKSESFVAKESEQYQKTSHPEKHPDPDAELPTKPITIQSDLSESGLSSEIESPSFLIEIEPVQSESIVAPIIEVPQATGRFSAPVSNDIANILMEALPEVDPALLNGVADRLAEVVHKHVPSLSSQEHDKLIQSFRDAQKQMTSMLNTSNPEEFYLNVDELIYYADRWLAVFSVLSQREDFESSSGLINEIRDMARNYYAKIGKGQEDPAFLESFCKDLEHIQTNYFSPTGKYGLTEEDRKRIQQRLNEAVRKAQLNIQLESDRLHSTPNLTEEQIGTYLQQERKNAAINIFPAIMGGLERATPESVWEEVMAKLPDDYEKTNEELFQRRIALREQHLEAFREQVRRDEKMTDIISDSAVTLEKENEAIINGIGD